MRKLALALAIAATAAVAQPSSAVVGGRFAGETEFPWTAAIYSGSSPGGQFCGGTLVSSKAVVTAKHCVNALISNAAASLPIDPFKTFDPLAIRLRIMVGSRYLNGGNGETRDVATVHEHPSSSIDVAVLTWSTAVNTSPIGYLTASSDASLDAPEVVATVTGWGATSEGGGRSAILKTAEVPIISDATCRSYYGSSFSSANEVCAGYDHGGTDTCQGDSGGPLVVKRPNGSWVLAGATSWGEGCARPQRPGVYAEMRAAAAFIASVA